MVNTAKRFFYGGVRRRFFSPKGVSSVIALEQSEVKLYNILQHGKSSGQRTWWFLRAMANLHFLLAYYFQEGGQ